MAKTFTNFNDLLQHVKQNLVFDLNKLGIEIRDVLRSNIRTMWYQRNGYDWTPEDYERTWNLIDSVQLEYAKNTVNCYQIRIFYDTNRIRPSYGTEDKPWTRHMSVTKDHEDVSKMIPYYIEYGNNNSSIYSYEGVKPVETTIQDLKSDNYIKERLKELLEMQGYKVLL